MSAVVSAVQDVGNAVGNAVSYVGNAVSDAGNWVGEKVVEPLVKAVDNTIQAAIDDPIGTAVKIAAISTGNPYIIAAANTGVALANGADPDDALKAGAKAAIMYEVGSAVGEYVAPEAAEYFGPENAATAAAVTNAAASTAAAAAVGEDPYQALLSSGVNSAAGVIAKQVPGYDSLSANQQRALKTTVAASLEGKDPSQALVNQALQVGINYVKNKDDGLNYGYEQAPDYVGADQEKLIETITASEDDGLNYGYEQAPEISPLFKADYSLSTGTDSLGLAPSALPKVFNPDGSVNYELVSNESGLGLQVPKTPNLDSMGGGQGLTAPAFGEPGGTVSEEGVFYDYNPLTGNVVPKIPPVKISSGAKPAPIQRSAPIQRRPSQANTLDNLMLMMQGAPVTSGDQEDLINLVKASPYFDINKPLDIGFFDQLINQQQKENLQNQQGVVKMAEGGYMDIFFPKTQLTMDDILKILEGK